MLGVAGRVMTGNVVRNAVVSNRQPCSRKVHQTYQTEATSDKKDIKTKENTIFEDKMRDSRNAEMRKIIKQQTSQRRQSLADSITIAKSVIDGHAKNKQFEKKAAERRRVIKHCTSTPESSTGEKKRCMSFAEELQTGRSVITPTKDHTKSLERSKERCRQIKDQCSGKRRRSLVEEIGVAKEIIVDSERKYVIPPAVVEEVSNQNHIILLQYQTSKRNQTERRKEEERMSESKKRKKERKKYKCQFHNFNFPFHNNDR